MAILGTTFDATTVDPLKPFELLPPGRYVVQIVGSEMRATNDGQGQYLWLEEDILEGEYQGRKLFDRLNLVNDNQQTVEIARRTLSAICHATGNLQVQDSEDLHLVPMIAVVRIKQPKEGDSFGPSNTMRYLPLEEQPAPPPQPAAAPAEPAAKPATAAAAPRSGTKSPPWRRPA